MSKKTFDFDNMSVQEIDNLMKELRQLRKEKVKHEEQKKMLNIAQRVLENVPENMDVNTFLDTVFSPKKEENIVLNDIETETDFTE